MVEEKTVSEEQPMLPVLSPILCLAIGSALAFVVFLAWLLLAAFG